MADINDSFMNQSTTNLPLKHRDTEKFITKDSIRHLNSRLNIKPVKKQSGIDMHMDKIKSIENSKANNLSFIGNNSDSDDS